MWCTSSDSTRSSTQAVPQAHHRIVRVPPGESVVLNSAERAPYLLLVEILNHDLDFDPSKRSNKEVLRKIVLKTDERRGGSATRDTFDTPTLNRFKTEDADVAAVDDRPYPGSPALVIPATQITPSGEDDEEMDLVEQVYGEDQHLKTADLSESIVLPPAPKNRDLDRVAWSSSAPPSPAIDSGLLGGGRLSISTSATSDLATSPLANQQSSFDASKTVISLDEYSERMRTAAIMLAQLNANLVRETVAPSPILTEGKSGYGSKGW